MTNINALTLDNASEGNGNPGSHSAEDWNGAKHLRDDGPLTLNTPGLPGIW